MNAVSLVLLFLIAAAFFFALKKAVKERGCSGQCGTCHKVCASRGTGETPAWVEAYRKDHPKD